MKKRLLKILICLGIMFSLTGCGSEEENKKVNSSANENKEYITYDNITEFDEGIAIATDGKDKYVVDENFNVLFSYKGNSQFVGKYMQIADVYDDKQINIVNQNGDIVYSYDGSEYNKKVEIIPGGFLIITEQTDTYNSSQTLTGIYDIESESYVLGPSAEYVGKISEAGDNMYKIDSSYQKFFNTKTKQIVTFDDMVMGKFVDGYYATDNQCSYDINKPCLLVYDDNGGKKEITLLFDSWPLVKDKNGMLIGNVSRFNYEVNANGYDGAYAELVNFATGTVKDLSEDFYDVKDSYFNKDGNALVLFNNQGGLTFYTVIDKDGNMLFEPLKCNKDTSLNITSDIFDGGYYFGEEDGYYKLFDKNNKVIYTSDNKDEKFISFSNNAILVELSERARPRVRYYKDLEGKQKALKVNGILYKYN